MSGSEREVVDEIARRCDDLVELARHLVRFDTQTHPLGEPRQEAALQAYVGERLRAAGLSVEIWEPEPGTQGAERLRLAADYHFRGRPQLLARRPGTGGGRSLLLNGHIDTVTVEPRDQWSVDPLEGSVRDGRLYGRGACDMKGGVAAMVFAAEVLSGLGVELRGDLLVNTVTDEESTAAGAQACALAGVGASGCIVPEGTAMQVGLGARGSLMPTITVHGRSGHAGLRQPHFTAGGAVNAIEKTQLVLDALRQLRADWATRWVHPHLDPADVVPVSISAGEWVVTQPGRCVLRCHLQYLPGQADDEGWGSRVERDFEEWLTAVAAADPWLCAHPPEVVWDADVPPSYVPPSDPVAAITLSTARDLGLAGRITSHMGWFDGATFVRHGTPSIAFGPGAMAHTVDEFVPLDELVAAAQVIAVTAMRFCGSS